MSDQKPAEVYVRQQSETNCYTVDDVHHHTDNPSVLILVKDEWDATRWVHWSDVQRVVGLPKLEQSDSTAAESHTEPTEESQGENSGQDDYHPEARKEAREILLELNPQVDGCDLIEEVSITHKNGGVSFDPSREVPSDEGTAWREFTSEHFGASEDSDEPGYINWGQTDSGVNYPDEFILPYSGIGTVRAGVSD